MKNETKAPKAHSKGEKAKTVVTQSRARLGEYKGFTAVRIIRQLGSLGWKAKETAEALNRLGLKPNMHTVYVQVLAGRNKQGPLAELTKKEIAGLKGKVGKAEKVAPKAKGKRITVKAVGPVEKVDLGDGRIAEVQNAELIAA